MMNNAYQDQEFERGVRAVVSRFVVREDYCEVCEDEINFVRLADCRDLWRCMGCLSILERKFVPVKEKTFKEYEANHKGKWDTDEYRQKQAMDDAKEELLKQQALDKLRNSNTVV